MWWLIPSAVTVGCVVVWLRPLPARGGDYDFSPEFSVLMRCFLLIPILATWLIYLLVKSFFA